MKQWLKNGQRTDVDFCFFEIIFFVCSNMIEQFDSLSHIDSQVVFFFQSFGSNMFAVAWNALVFMAKIGLILATVTGKYAWESIPVAIFCIFVALFHGLGDLALAERARGRIIKLMRAKLIGTALRVFRARFSIALAFLFVGLLAMRTNIHWLAESIQAEVDRSACALILAAICWGFAFKTVPVALSDWFFLGCCGDFFEIMIWWRATDIGLTWDTVCLVVAAIIIRPTLFLVQLDTTWDDLSDWKAR